MGHTPYGYSIENGCATIKEDEANKIRKLYENYISGMALAKAAAAAGHDIADATVYVCEICGHTVMGDVPDRCPVCSAPKAKFKAF